MGNIGSCLKYNLFESVPLKIEKEMFSEVTEEPEILECRIEWKIKSFNKYRDFMYIDQFLTSKQFFNPRCPSIKWELRVYPCGITQYANKVYISLIRLNHNLKPIFAFGTLDANKKVSSYFEYTNLCFVLNESTKFFVDVQPHLHTDGSVSLVSRVQFMPLDVKCKPKETFKFSPADTSHKLLTNMFQQGTLTDCVINIGDEKINAHSCILAQNSEVFLRMFEQKGMLEAQNVLKSRKRPYETGEINIVDYSAECFRAFLEYLYTGEINKILLEKHVDDLFTLSDKYEVLPLREICVQVMASKITATNFYKRYSFAEIFKLPLVEMACINFISANRKTFLGSNEWNEFKRANKDLATKLLESSAFD
ncbi:hypothetical protein ACQ4LE_010644 [Meloidogyne hapla]